MNNKMIIFFLEKKCFKFNDSLKPRQKKKKLWKWIQTKNYSCCFFVF